MKFSLVRIFWLLQILTISAPAANCVVNLSHYDLMHPDFGRMKDEGILAVIHEASYPRFERDALYTTRQQAATRLGLLWGAYHFGDGTDPVRQADHFMNIVASAGSRIEAQPRPASVLLVLDFEQNTHYPGGSMRVDQAVTFAERVRERTGKYPGIYASEYRIRSVLNNSKVSASQRRVLANCWLWIANYHYVPRAVEPWSRWHLWQYTGDGKCDLPRASYPKSVANIRKAERNIFHGSREGLLAFWQEHSWDLAPDLPGQKPPKPKAD